MCTDWMLDYFLYLPLNAGGILKSCFLSFLNQNVGQTDGSGGATLLSDHSFYAQSSQITQLLVVSQERQQSPWT